MVALKRIPWLIISSVTSITILLYGLYSAPAFAIGSPNFQIEEDFLGGAGGIEGSSPNFQSRESLGAPAVGGGASGNFSTESGSVTPDEPVLSFMVNSASVNLGALSTSLTRTGEASFSVLNYTSYGYIVQAIGSPPDNGGHALTAMNTSASSAAGTEQFGINLVANTAPTAFGANPQQQPDSTFGFGKANAGYGTTNNYKYVPGEVIASASKSSGVTNYTISYIANIGTNTPRGSYSGNQTLVATGTY